MTACRPRQWGVRPWSLQKSCGSRAVTQARLKLAWQQLGWREEAQLQQASGAGGTSDFNGGFAAAAITAMHPTGEGDCFQSEAYKQASSANEEQRKERSEELASKCEASAVAS